jgi:phospholipase C
MRRLSILDRPSAIAALALLLSACGGAGRLTAVPALPGLSQLARSAKIQHVVIIVQENRSFNNLFYGYPGAKTTTYGYNTKNQKIPLKPVTLATTWDPQHDANGFFAACNGTGKIPGTDCRMNGFDLENCGNLPCPIKNAPYAYVPRDEVAPYLDMAKQYVLADQMYASDFDESSFISHQYIIAGTNPDSTIDYPDQQWGCSGNKNTDGIDVLQADRVFKNTDKVYPCWNPPTLGDELDTAGLAWAYYAVSVSPSGDAQSDGKSSRGRGIWSAYQAIKHIYEGTDWGEDVISPPSRFLNYVSGGKLGAVTWITPTYQNSDHGGSGYKTGPSWVAAVVNAVGESQYWNSTAVFIFWDDPGGWYDSEPPAYANNDGLGMRLPLLIISPYAKKNHVSHVHYEHGSILRFVEDEFGLPRLSASDKRANSPAQDCFDFSQSPRKFVPIQSPYDAEYFKRQRQDLRPPDTD